MSAGVVNLLRRLRGVWHDRIEAFDLAGAPLSEDAHGGTPGALPYDNLVYIDFDGEAYRQTNVCFRGRPVHVRTFAGAVRDGVLVFHRLGPRAPEHIGVSGGPDVLIFAPRAVDAAWERYAEPDVIRLVGEARRERTTLLYRGGRAVRSLAAHGVRVSPVADRRVPWDPRGERGPVHEAVGETEVFRA